MNKILYTLLLFFASNTTFAQLNVDYISSVDYNVSLNDCWGYVAPDSTEYALVGLQNGVSVINLADPANPVESAFLPGASSTWRDIKTWGEYAYVTNETGNGLAVIDLTDLPNSATVTDWAPDLPEIGGTLSSIHNIWIDEFGVAYLVGSNLNEGGALFVDVATTPGEPIYMAAGAPIYSHDIYVRDNIAYSSEIYTGAFAIYDVTDKNNVVLEGTQTTGAEFTHNAWLSDDGNTLFTTDETGNAPVGAYDVSDFSNIQELDQFRPLETLGEGVIPHNVHVWSNWLIISYYTDGCIIVDATHPDNLIEVGNWDSFIPDNAGFDGAWGAYPFLPSGLVLLSDIGNGLLVLAPDYVQACYLEGTITDADNNNLINGATIKLLTTNITEDSGLNGVYKTGTAISGTYEVEADHPLYEAQTGMATLVNGEIVTLDFALIPLPSFSVSGNVTDLNTGAVIPNAIVKVQSEVINTTIETDAGGNFTLDQIVEGDYNIIGGLWGYKQVGVSAMNLTETNNTISIQLEEGIEDGFGLDLGWTTTLDGFQGEFVRALSIGIDVGGGIFITPNEDVNDPGDIGEECYVTGNNTDGNAGVLIGSATSMTSPYFDLTDYTDPMISYYHWFFNIDISGMGQPGPSDEDMYVILSNGSTSAVIDTITMDESFFAFEGWKFTEKSLLGYIPFTDSMQITFETEVVGTNAIVEAAVDYVRVWDAFMVNTVDLGETVNTFNVYPNPSNNQFTLSYDLNTLSENTQIRVYNILGQTVKTIPVQQPIGQVFFGEDFDKGVYFVQLVSEDGGTEALKLIKH